ncbi:hypothetical protein WN944_002511 [Citrus x changshan-huyou]|uniref:KH type-2 domain-containing protein n=2 Tax=Citrus TaxID=2706 RepID=A0ACB8P4R4_CITSI|nr:KH type-2 domain-containing protein [Citrus sinensis]
MGNHVFGQQFVADGVFFAELNEVLTRELNEVQPFRNGSSFQRTVWSYMLRKLTIGVCVPLPRPSPSVTTINWACYGVLRFIMESGAKGCEVIVSGKLRAQRAKSMKFKDGYMISSGYPVKEYIDSAVRHVLIRQASSIFCGYGVIGIKVKIMLAWDAKGKQGPVTPLPDLVTIHTPKEEENVPPIMPTSLELPIA